MKNIKTVLLILGLVFLATGCSKIAKEDQPTEESTKINESAAKADSKKELSEGSKVLVAYFTYGENTDSLNDTDVSSSASIQMLDGKITGNTGLIANEIAEATGGDKFSILTVKKYPSNYDDNVDTGQNEKNNHIKPAIANHIENLDDYDTVFIGYPNWWYGMPMVMYSFFDEYDFSNKTIIPFCTSGGSAFSDSINDIKELEPNADVIDNGLHIGASDANGAHEQVQEWLTGLNFK